MVITIIYMCLLNVDIHNLQMLHGEGQIIFTVIIVLAMVSTSTSLPANYQPGYDGYQPAGYRGRIKKEPQNFTKYGLIRKGRDYNKPAYNYAADKGPRSYYEPISE